MKAYLVVFGRTPDLSWAELQSFYPDAVRVRSDCAVLNFSEEIPFGWINSFGGIVKTAELLSTIGDPSRITGLNLFQNAGNSVDFGLSFYSDKPVEIKKYLDLVKADLVSRGYRVRYRLPRHNQQLSSATIGKAGVQDIIAVETAAGWLIGKTVAVQDFEFWNFLDYGRPAADAKTGMLPPKVARMMVNLALGGKTSGVTAADPFCGMGTIAADIWLRGGKVYASDIDTGVLTKCRRNLRWLTEQFPAGHGEIAGIETADATHLSETHRDRLLDAIITEPYLGPTGLGEGKISQEKAKNIARGLDKLYLGCLRDWSHILKSGAVVCWCLPTISLAGSRISVKKAIDTCENLGYTKLLGPITYAREQAVVLRDIYLLRKK